METTLIIEFFPILFIDRIFRAGADLIGDIFGGGETHVAVTTPQQTAVNPVTNVSVYTPVEAPDLTPIERAMTAIGLLGAYQFELSTAAKNKMVEDHTKALETIIEKEKQEPTAITGMIIAGVIFIAILAFKK